VPVDPVDGVPLVPGVVGTPPTVFADEGVCGRPGLDRFRPGLLVPVTVFDGVPRLDSVPLVGGTAVVVEGVTVLDGVVVVDGIGVAEGAPIDGVVVDGETCEMAGLRCVGISGREVVTGVVTGGCVGLGRTRSPSGIPWSSARPLGGRGTANTKSDAAASAAS